MNLGGNSLINIFVMIISFLLIKLVILLFFFLLLCVERRNVLYIGKKISFCLFYLLYL